MADITLTNRTITASYTGAVICRTPRQLNDIVVNEVAVDQKCILCTSTKDLIKYFGDPFINPHDYVELVLAYRLLERNVPIYISSIHDMVENTVDDFDVPYNGYTEFYFKDKNGYDTIGYTLKSDLKFLQPIIQSERKTASTLTFYVSLYLLEGARTPNVIKPDNLYRTYEIELDILKDNDASLIEALSEFGLELHVKNATNDNSLIKEFYKHKRLTIVSDQSKHGALPYRYDLHNDLYELDLNSDEKIIDSYLEAITLLSHKPNAPLFLGIGNIYRSYTINDESDGIHKSLIGYASPDVYASVHTMLLEMFPDSGDTYLFISTPKVTVSELYSLLEQDYKYPDCYNCDLFYNSIIEYTRTSLFYQQIHGLSIPASLVSFYSILLGSEAYISNSIGGLNIVNSHVQSVIERGTASELENSHINSAVLFVTRSPSIYGDRSLSSLPSLGFSHISRNFVLIRRLIREYLETRKFILNSKYNIDQCVNYIGTSILDTFVTLGIVQTYTVEYISSEGRTAYFLITLRFAKVIESIQIEFTI